MPPQHMQPHPTEPGKVWDVNFNQYIDNPVPSNVSGPAQLKQWRAAGSPVQGSLGDQGAGVDAGGGVSGGAGANTPILTEGWIDGGDGFEINPQTGERRPMQTEGAPRFTNTIKVRMEDGRFHTFNDITPALDAALQAGGIPIDPISGADMQVTPNVNGGYLFDNLPINVIMGGGFEEGQIPALTDYYNQQGGVSPGAPPGFGSFAEPFDVPFTGTSVYESRQFDEPFDFTYEDFVATPAFQHMMEQGQKAIDRGEAAGGRFNAPRRQKELQRFTAGETGREFRAQQGEARTDYLNRENVFRRNEAARASDYDRSRSEYLDRYNIFSKERGDIFNRYSALTGGGQVAGRELANTGNQFGQQYGGVLGGSTANVNNWLTGGASARSAGVLAGGAGRAAGGVALGNAADRYRELYS